MTTDEMSLEEEIDQLRAYRDGRIKWVSTGYMGYPDAQHEADVFQRILVREQGVLAELRRGMKQGGGDMESEETK